MERPRRLSKDAGDFIFVVSSSALEGFRYTEELIKELSFRFPELGQEQDLILEKLKRLRVVREIKK